MAKIVDTISRFGRAKAENLTKIWDVGLGAVNPTKIWNTALGQFDHNKINNFAIGLKLGGGTTVNAVESGTWTATSIQSLGDWNIGSITQEITLWLRINNIVHFCGRFAGTATTGGGGPSGLFIPSGLPGFSNAAKVIGSGSATIAGSPEIVHSIFVGSNSPSDSNIYLQIQNDVGTFISMTNLVFSGMYQI